MAAPAVHKRLAVDWARSTSDDQRLSALELALVNHATPHDAHPVYRRRSGPGVGKSVALVMRHAMHDIPRVPRGQAVVSYGRLVTGATASAGTRYGTSGTTIGTASRTCAFSAAAGLVLRPHPAGPQCLAQ